MSVGMSFAGSPVSQSPSMDMAAGPERKPEVVSSLDGVAMSIARLHDRLTVLEDRLRPACAQRPDNVGPQEAPVGSCDLSTQIASRGLEIEVAIFRIERLLANLEI